MKIKYKKIAFGLTSSFYAFNHTIKEIKKLVREYESEVIPIMSEHAFSNDSKFGKASDFAKQLESITKRKVICTMREAEEVDADILVIAPCSGNSIAKLASSIYDTSVLVCAKTHLRKNKPVLLRNYS